MSRQPSDAERAVTRSRSHDVGEVHEVRFVSRIPKRTGSSFASGPSPRNSNQPREPRNTLLPSLSPLQGNDASTLAVVVSNSRGTVDNTPQGTPLDSQVRALWTAHDTLVGELKSLQEVVMATPVKEVAGDFRILRSDVNYVLEILVQPATFIEGVEARFDRIGGCLETLEQFFLMDKPSPDDPVNEASHNDQLAGKKKRRHRRKHHRKYSDSDSLTSSDSSQNHLVRSRSSDSDSEDEKRGYSSRSKRSSATEGVIRTRQKGRRHPGIRDLKPTNPDYRKLLSYRYYRLEDSSLGRKPRGTGKVRECIKQMQLSLRNQYFTGEDPVLVLDFLSRFVAEADILRMNERQAYLALPYFLRGVAEDQYNSVRGSSRASEGGVTCWPEAVQYLLRSYATNTAIQQAILALRDTRQRAGESETDYSVGLNKAFHRCGNVYPAEERCTMFIDGLDPAIRSLVTRYREDKRSITYLELVQHARAEGNALRARTPNNRVKSTKALLLESEASSLPLTVDGNPAQVFDTVHLVQGNGVSIPTTDLPSTTEMTRDTGTEDPILYGGNGQFQPQRLPLSNGQSRYQWPGWTDTRPVVRFSDTRNNNPRVAVLALICHLCYAHGHTSPQCICSLKDMAKVVANYEALTPEEKRSVPTASYLPAKTDFSHALPQTPRARQASYTLNREIAQPSVATPAYADRNPRQRDEALGVEETNPLPKAEN